MSLEACDTLFHPYLALVLAFKKKKEQILADFAQIRFTFLS